MQTQKTYFEQIPVETVKKIAELDVAIVNDSNDNSVIDIATTNELRTPTPTRARNNKTWQEIARAVSQETDPIRMVELCRELNEALLIEEEGRRPRLALVRGSDDHATASRLEV